MDGVLQLKKKPMTDAITTQNSGHSFWLAEKIRSVQAGLGQAKERHPREVIIIVLRLPFVQCLGKNDELFRQNA